MYSRYLRIGAFTSCRNCAPMSQRRLRLRRIASEPTIETHARRLSLETSPKLDGAAS